MITLPIVTSGTKVTAAAGSADAGTENTLGLAQAADGAAGEESSKGFLTLLGNKLLTFAQQSAGSKAGTGKVAAVEAETTEAQAGQSSKAKLNALLAALDKPEHLTALLQPAKSTDGLKTTEGDKAEDVPLVLNSGDMQALQALYAMLPPAGIQPPMVNQGKSGEALPDSEDFLKSGKNSTLASLLTSPTNTEDQGAKATGGNNGKLSSTASLSTAQPANSPADASLTASFQQALSHAGKEVDKENSSSVSPTTITNNVLSSASAALTPTTTSMVTAPPPAQLSSQLGSQEWQQALGQQILMFSKNGQQTAELHLHPQDLGSIQISLKLDADQASLSMVSNHSQVRAALEAAMPQLRTALAENGINLGQSSVSSDAFQQGQSSNGQQGQQRNDRGNTFSLSSDNSGDATPIAVPAALQARAAGSNAVDIFA